MGPEPRLAGWKKPLSPNQHWRLLCAWCGVVVFPPLLCPTRISEKSTFSYFLCLIKQNQRKCFALLEVQRCFSSEFATKGHFGNKLPTKHASAVCSSRPAVPLNWWPFGCFILYEIVSFSFFSLMGDFTTNPIFFFMPYIFSCWIFGLVWKCHIIDNSI